MRGDFQQQVVYFRHLYELMHMSLDREEPHRFPVQLYRARK
ncbi:MAG: hypothetical protein R6V27_14110 [Balneolaceae bacterium]